VRDAFTTVPLVAGTEPVPDVDEEMDEMHDDGPRPALAVMPWQVVDAAHGRVACERGV
jgi:hypothetical protein